MPTAWRPNAPPSAGRPARPAGRTRPTSRSSTAGSAPERGVVPQDPRHGEVEDRRRWLARTARGQRLAARPRSPGTLIYPPAPHCSQSITHSVPVYVRDSDDDGRGGCCISARAVGGVSSAPVVPAASGSAGRAASSPVARLRSTASLSRPKNADPGREGRTAMPGESRSLPGRPNLRYLSSRPSGAWPRASSPPCTTRRRPSPANTACPAGPPSSSWSATRRAGGPGGPGGGDEDDKGGEGHEGQQSHALDQLRWVISRFAGAGQPGWTPPRRDELRQHFDDRFLSVLPPAALVPAISQLAGDLSERRTRRSSARPRCRPTSSWPACSTSRSVEAEPPYRLAGLRGLPAGSRVRDPRVAAPAPPRTQGDVPAEVPEIAAQAVAELGLAALALAGGGGDPRRPVGTGPGLGRPGPRRDPGSRPPVPGARRHRAGHRHRRAPAGGRRPDRPGPARPTTTCAPSAWPTTP